MDEHICHHGDTLQHRDVVECHREAYNAASKYLINEPMETCGKIQNNKHST